MGFRFHKRVGRRAGLNFSKSGVSASFRGRWGSVGTRGYSIRTGIPGLFFRGGISRRARRSRASGMGGFGLIVTLIKLIALPILIIAWILQSVIWPCIKSLSRVLITQSRLKVPEPRRDLQPSSSQPAFAYTARDWAGKYARGTINVADRASALKHLEQMRLVPISLREIAVEK